MSGPFALLVLWLLGRMRGDQATPRARAPSPARRDEPKKPAPEQKKSAVIVPSKVAPIVQARAVSQPSPWPTSTPSHLPPWPGEGWEADVPPPLEVQARAMQLLRPLHERGVSAHVIEQTGGRWIAYVARLHGAKRAVEAYRERGSAPSRAPVPTPVKRSDEPPQGVLAVSRVEPVRAVPVSSPAPAPAPAPARVRPTLRYGASVREVAELQEMLGIKIDSKFGPETDRAVRAYQRTHGLAADGIVGPLTWASLDSRAA